MELLKASTILTTADFFAPNGSGAIVTSDPKRRTSSSFTIKTTGIVTSRGKRPCRSSKKMASGRFSPLPDTNYPRSALKFWREPFPSFVSSAAIESWISLGSILPFLRPLFILMSGLKSLRACIRFNFTAGMNASLPSPTNYRHGWTQTLKKIVLPPNEWPIGPAFKFLQRPRKKHEGGTYHKWDKWSWKLSTAPPLTCS